MLHHVRDLAYDENMCGSIEARKWAGGSGREELHRYPPPSPAVP